MRSLSWALWSMGTVLVVLSWFHVVSPAVGWMGFAAGFLGSILSVPGMKRVARAREAEAAPSKDVADLEKLADLRERGVLSEEEFAAQKKKILDRPPA